VVADDLVIKIFVSESFAENTYVVHKSGCADCFIIDPGFEPELIIDYLKKNHITPQAILVTHGHMDHVAGNEAIKNEWENCRIYIGKEDAYKLTDPRGNLSMSFGFPMTSPPADYLLSDGEKFIVAGIEIEALYLPGHSRGHVIYLIRSETELVLFSGDVIFADSIGRYDFPDGNYDALIDGIREKILTLPESTTLYPGHGPKTTVGRERRYNPFLAGDIC